MAVKYTKRYTNEAEYILDVAKGSDLFRADAYDALDSEQAIDYSYAVAGTKNRTSDTFNVNEYDMLGAEDKSVYLMNEYYADKKSDEYSKTKEYLDYKLDEAKAQMTYESLSGLEKTLNNIGGILGNATNDLLFGTIEGLIDVTATVLGQTDFAKEDITGYSRNRQKLQEFNRAYTDLDKKGIWRIANDVTSGLIKMAPLLLNTVAPGVGSAIYFGSMAGNTAEETLKDNADIDYLSLIGYTGFSVGLEIATEKLSGAILGRGTAIDNLFNKAKGTTAGSWISHIGLDFLSEGLEESISEFGNEVLHAMIINKDQPFAEFDMLDILYAGLVGGLIGGVSAGTRIARTQKQVILEDGSVMSKKEADALNLKGKVLGKAQSLNLMDAIAEAQEASSNTAESKLIKKYSQKGESINSIKSNHAEEYQKALDTDAKHQDELVKTALGLARILQMAGPARFEKAVKIAEYTVEKKQELIRNYKNSIANLTGLTAAQKQVAKEFQTKTGYSIDFKQDLNVVEKSIQNKLKNEYGINVQFGYLGKLDGINTYHAATLNEKTIILDANLSNTMSLDSIIDQIVKEELVHTLQYASGILTKRNMQELMKTYHSSKSNVLRLTETDLDRAYAGDSDITKISERQAKALAQVLLFDELSVSKMFMTNRNIISRVYHWLKGLRDNTKKQGIKNRKQQVKFNTILKSMRMYQNAVASKITNAEDLTTLAELFSLDSTEQQYIYDRIPEDPTNEHFTLMKMQISITSLSMSEAQKMLEDNFVTSKLGEKITNPKGFVATLLNPETYNTEFVEKVMSANPGKDFRYNLQAFLINNYNVSINERYGVLTETVDLNSVTTPEFRKNLEKLPKDPDALSDYWKLSEIFNDDFNAKFPYGELDDIELIFNVTDKANPVKAEFGTDRETQTKYIKVNIPEKGANVSQIAHALYHETTHALATLMDLPNGTSTVAVKRGLSMATPKQIKFLADKLLTKDFYNENKNNTGLITDYLAYAIYRVTDGEYAAEMYKTSAVREGETDIQLKSGHNLNTSGFYVNGNTLQGYGIFKDITLDTTKTGDNAQLKSAKLRSLEGLIKASEVVSYSKTNELSRFLKEKGLSDYQKAGFSESFEGLLLSGTATKTEIRDFLAGDLIGTPKATNAIIEWLYPDNKHLKTIEDVKEILTPDENEFSLLTFGLVYGKALANVEGNKTAPNDPFDIKEGVMKTPLIDNKKLFTEVNNIIHSNGNDNYITDKLLSMDFDFSIKQSTELLSALEKSLAWQADLEYVPAQTGEEGKEFDVSDVAAFKEYNEAKYNPKGVKEKITAKWKRVTSSEVRSFKDSLADWILRKHKGASDSNELDVLITRIEAARKNRNELDDTSKKQIDRFSSVDLMIDAMNSAFNTLDNTEQVVTDEEQDTTIKEGSRVVVTTGTNKGVSFNVSAIYDKGKIDSDEKIKYVKGTSNKGKKIEVPISDVEITTRKSTKATTHFDIRNKILNNEEKLVTVFGQKGYEKLLVELKKHVPTSKQNLESKVKSRIKNIESRSDLTLKEKAIVGIDRSNFTPKDYEKYIDDLDKIVSRETSAKDVATPKTKEIVKPETKETVDVKTVDEIRKEVLKTDEAIKEAKTAETAKETPKKEITPEDEEIDKEKYKEQAGQYKTIRIDAKAVSKSETLIKLMDIKEISDYQGDFDNPEYIKASGKILEANEEFFESITSEELMGMFKYLHIIEDDFMASDAAYNLLMRYAYKNKGSQFKDISEFIKTKNKRMSTQAAQFLGGLSTLYGHSHITKLLNSVAGEKGYDLQIPEEIMMKFASEYAKTQIRNLEDEIKHLKEELDTTKDNNTKIQLEEKIQTLNNTKPADSIDGFVKSLETEIDNLREKLKNTEDPWTKKQLNHEIDYKENIMETIQEGDFAEAADLITTYMQDNVTHVDSTENAISGLYEDIVKWLIALPDVAKIPGLNKSKQQFLSDSAQKKLTDTLSIMTSIRYMAMLSNPVTGLRNAVVNTSIAALNRVEMRGAKWLENTKLLDQPSQIRITGDFDANFSNHVDDLFGAKFKELLTGNKYDTNEIDKAKRKYAEEKDPINKSKILKKIKELESKMLSDTPWTYPKAMRTLKTSLAGSRSVILAECLNVLYPTYLKNTPIKDRNTALLKSKITDNPKMLNLVTKAIDGDLTATIDLAMELKLDIMNIDNENSIPYYALYKSNELFLKTNNLATKLQTTLAKNHPGAAAMVSFIAPFMRVSVNSLGYIINRSPIALAKGVLKACQTRTVYLSDMKEGVVDYYRDVYKKSLPKEQKYKEQKFIEWYSDNVPQEVQTAVEKGGKQIKEVYDKMSEEGKVNPLKIGADDRFLRTESLQELSQGIVGTSLMVLGCVLAAATDAFDYDDDDDYLGAIIRIGDLKIALEDLSPFSTMFTVGAMLSSGNIDNKMDAIFGIIADASFLGIIDSAVKYSDSFKSYLENQFINSLTQYIPALTKNVRKSFGAKKDKSGTFGEKLLKTLASNTMLFSWLVPNKVNPYTGEPDKYYESGIVESLIGTVSPIGFRLDAKSKLQREAEAMKAETQGLTGRFTVNGDDIVVTGKDKENLAKYRAKYIQDEFDKISSGKQLVTVEDANGKRITTTYNKLSSEQKNRVLKNLYSKASDISKIKYWTDKGNYYVITDRKLYNEYSELFKQSQLLYKSEWSKSKFVSK